MKHIHFFHFLWMSISNLIGIGMFTFGFFLTRVEVDKISSCHDALIQNNEDSLLLRSIHRPGSEEMCWTEKSYDHILILLVDALRYDFVAPIESNSEKPKFWHNKLTKLQDVLKLKPTQTRLFKFHADAPTTTMQRLKGMTTGGLPTFIDIGKNFDSTAVHEDNIIKQMVRKGKRTVFMGDDTWEMLYPNHFNYSAAYPSFNVKDLHTVDDGVIKHLFPHLNRTIFDHNSGARYPAWNFLVGHFLGVDHVGHRYGPDTAVMSEKLGQMNEIIGRVIELMQNNLPENSLLLVCGDHGMTETGDHGGASPEETNAALFVYSNKPLHPSDDSSSQSTEKEEKSKVRYAHHIGKMVNQVDLVPTLSLLSGIPIPYGNIGAIIPDLFPTATTQLNSKSLNDNVNVKNDSDYNDNKYISSTGTSEEEKAVFINGAQIYRYLNHYNANAGHIPQDKLNELNILYQQSLNLLDSINDTTINGSRSRNSSASIESMKSYIDNAGVFCRSMWTTFDMYSMVLGGFVLASNLILIFVVFVMNYEIPKQLIKTYDDNDIYSCNSYFINTIDSKLIFWSLKVSSFIYIGVEIIFFTGKRIQNQFHSGNLSTAIIEISLVSIVVFNIRLAMKYIPPMIRVNQTNSNSCTNVNESLNYRFQWKNNRCLIFVFLTVLHGCSLTSNSYIVSEHNTLLFITMTSYIVLFCVCCRYRLHVHRSEVMLCLVTAMCCTRIIHSYQDLSLKDAESKVSLVETIVPLFCIAGGYSKLLRLKCKLVNYSDSYISFFVSLSLWLSVIALSLFWSLQYLDVLQSYLQILLPQMVFFLAFVVNVVTCIYKWLTRNHGTITCIESLVVLVPPIVLILGPQSPLLMLLVLINVFAVLYSMYGIFHHECEVISKYSPSITSNSSGSSSVTPEIEGKEHALRIEGLVLSNGVSIGLLLSFFTHFLYFSTGHTNDFSSLQHNAGFIGVQQFNLYVSGFLVFFNTSSPYILMFSLFPVAAFHYFPDNNNSNNKSIVKRFLISMQGNTSATNKHENGATVISIPLQFIFWITIFYHCFNLVITTMFVMCQRRHLMVWAIFAPKYIFDAGHTILTHVLVFLMYM